MLLTIKEVAKALKISLSMAYRLVAVGEIPCYEIGSCKRVSEDDLKQFLVHKKKQVIRLPKGQRKHF